MEILLLLIWAPLALHIYWFDYRDRRSDPQVITGFMDRRHREYEVYECRK